MIKNEEIKIREMTTKNSVQQEGKNCYKTKMNVPLTVPLFKIP